MTNSKSSQSVQTFIFPIFIVCGKGLFGQFIVLIKPVGLMWEHPVYLQHNLYFIEIVRTATHTNSALYNTSF